MLVMSERGGERTLDWVLLLRSAAGFELSVMRHALIARVVCVELMPPRRQIR